MPAQRSDPAAAPHDTASGPAPGTSGRRYGAQDEEADASEAIQRFYSNVAQGSYGSIDGGNSVMKLDMLCNHKIGAVRQDCYAATTSRTDETDKSCSFTSNLMAQIFLRQKERGVQGIDATSI